MITMVLMIFIPIMHDDTVDGRNPQQPFGMYKTL